MNLLFGLAVDVTQNPYSSQETSSTTESTGSCGQHSKVLRPIPGASLSEPLSKLTGL